MAAFWNAGTITLTENSAAVTGQGTDFLGSTARAGDTIESDDGRRATIASINSATSITLDKPWRGTGQTAAAYKLWFTPDDVILEGQGRRALANLSSGNITALSGLVGAANKLPFFTGAGTMDTTDLTPAARELLDDATFAAMLATLGAEPSRTLVTQAEAQAGTTTAVRAWSPQRVGQAIAALGSVPADVYRRANALGTVSQSGGVPTGAIAERGSNANGEYVRYADGTQICMLDNVTFTRGSNSFASFSWTYPAAFVGFSAVPFAVRSVGSNMYTGDITSTSVGGMAANSGAGAATTLYFMRTDGGALWSTGVISGCRVAAIGRWF